MTPANGNLSRNERLMSLGAGAVLTALATRGGPMGKVIYGLGALGFLGRAFAGHCAMKASLKGESSLREGFAQQWQHTKSRMRREVSDTNRVSDPIAASEKAVREQDGEASWMSHQNGRVTGAGVAAGAGDSEAGTASVR
jgi:hypothetical protein